MSPKPNTSTAIGGQSNRHRSAAVGARRNATRRGAMGRREFLLGLGAVGLGACAVGGEAPRFDLGSGGQLSILNWDGYIDADAEGDPYYGGGSLDVFIAQSGSTLLARSLKYDTRYTDNYSGFELIVESSINTKPPLYDIVVPTNWRAAQLVNDELVEPLPIEIIPNHVNIDPAFLTNAWDRGCRFQMPWQAGITGIAYNPAATDGPINSVSELFSPALAGRVGFIGEMREAVGLAMLANGDDPSRPTRATAEAGLDLIERAVGSGQVGAFTFDDFTDKLETGELDVAMAWSGDTADLQSRRPDIEFVVPDEGAIQWFDTMLIPKESPNLRAAGQFMNFVYEPRAAANITEAVQYLSPVVGVEEELRSRGGAAAELANSPVLFPDPATRARLFTWGGLSTADEDELDERFTELLPAELLE
jgi:spermidine/putrescine transport system substrate-binding protein